MKKFIILALSLALLLISTSLVFAEDVNSTNDTVLSQTATVSGTSFDNIQETIDVSKDNDVIELNGKYTINNKPITINKPMTIQGSGNGAVLDARNLNNIMEIRADNVILKNLEFTNAKGNAINDVSFGIQDLTIVNCTFYNNGGYRAIEYKNYEVFGALTISDSTFNGNSGGAVGFVGNQLKVTGCKFTDNAVGSEGLGGALSIYAKSAAISNSIFKNNHADSGGAISVSCSNLEISHCSFTSNRAKKEGGAIVANGYMEEVKNDNIPWTLSILDSDFTSNKANDKQDAIYSLIYNVNIANSNFGSNQRVYVKLGDFKNTNNHLTNKKHIKTVSVVLKPESKSITYGGGYSVHVKTENIPFISFKVKIVVYNKSFKKTYYETYYGEDSDNVWFYINKLAPGKYNVKIYLISKLFKAKTIKTKLTIKKAKATVYAPKIKAKYKKSKKFKVTLVNPNSQDPIKKIKIKIKVFTGKKSKTYTVKTNKDGIAKIDTKNLKKGKHKVKITAKSKYYIVNKKSSIRIV